MDLSSLGHNLRRLRDAQKLTQAELAERADLSRVAYGSIESGSSSPKLKNLLRIAEVLDVRLEELLTPTKTLQAVRFRAAKKMVSREQVLLDVGRWLSNYAELEELLDEREEFLFARLSRSLATKPKSSKRARDAAAQARKVLNLEEGEGIRDICGLLEERAGIKVYPMQLASDGFFGLSVGEEDGGPAIVVNVWDRISVERWIFTAAHELGHILLHLPAFDVNQIDEDPGQESEADQFGSHFLMPHEVFVREWAETWGHSLIDRVLKVKRMFRVSYKTVLYRLSEDPTYGAAIWKQFQIACKRQLGRALKRSDELQGLRPKDFHAAMVESRAADEPKRLSSDDFVEDRLLGLVREALDKKKISVTRAADILGIEVKTMRAHAAAWVD